jgi:hypothetical protein
MDAGLRRYDESLFFFTTTLSHSRHPFASEGD